MRKHLGGEETKTHVETVRRWDQGGDWHQNNKYANIDTWGLNNDVDKKLEKRLENITKSKETGNVCLFYKNSFQPPVKLHECL